MNNIFFMDWLYADVWSRNFAVNSFGRNPRFWGSWGGVEHLTFSKDLHSLPSFPSPSFHQKGGGGSMDVESTSTLEGALGKKYTMDSASWGINCYFQINFLNYACWYLCFFPPLLPILTHFYLFIFFFMFTLEGSGMSYQIQQLNQSYWLSTLTKISMLSGSKNLADPHISLLMSNIFFV